MVRALVLVFLLSLPVFAVNDIDFDPKTSTKTVVDDYEVIISSWAMKAHKEKEKALYIIREYKNFRSFSKKVNDTTFDIGLEFDVVPSTNMWEFKIDGAENYDFFLQGELTAEELAQGAVRPENILNSYAVFDKLTNGKVFHIYRSKLIDKNGNTSWCDQRMINGKLCVVGDKTWLDNAQYPVTLDPTLGLTSIGGSGINSVGNFRDAKLGCVEQTATVQSVSVAYYWATGGTANLKLALYADTGALYPGALVSGSSTGKFYVADLDVPIANSNWHTQSMGGTLNPGTTYWVAIMAKHGSEGSGGPNWTFDSGSWPSHYTADDLYDTFPQDPAPVGMPDAGQRFGIYITYAPAGGAALKTKKVQVLWVE